MGIFEEIAKHEKATAILEAKKTCIKNMLLMTNWNVFKIADFVVISVDVVIEVAEYLSMKIKMVRNLYRITGMPDDTIAMIVEEDVEFVQRFKDETCSATLALYD